MNEITNTYDPARLESIRRVLENEQRRGSPRYYEIWVDGVKVVEKTNEPQQFDKYEEFLYADTQKVTVNLFTSSQSSAHIVSKHHFTFGDEQKKEVSTPSGLSLGEIDAKINEKVSEKVFIERERWDCEQVKKDLALAKEKLTEAEEYAEKLQTIIDETKTKLQQAHGMGEITSIIKDLAIPYLTGNKPSEKEALSGNEKPSGEASFKMKSSEESSSASEAEKNLWEFAKSLERNFTQEEFDMILSVIDEFAKDKTSIKPVQELLNINTNQQKNQKTK